MFIVIDNHTGQTQSAHTLTQARTALQTLEDGAVCDEDGIIRGTIRNGVYTPCNEHGFPERASHAA